MPAEKIVKVGEFGGRVKDYLLADGETVPEILEKAGFAGRTGVRVNGTPLSTFGERTSLRGGELITIVKEVKGGVAA